MNETSSTIQPRFAPGDIVEGQVLDHSGLQLAIIDIYDRGEPRYTLKPHNFTAKLALWTREKRRLSYWQDPHDLTYSGAVARIDEAFNAVGAVPNPESRGE
jgi:hypothetical protein